jgi:hypothetical protein
MVLFVFALPGRFAEWCDAVTAQLARSALGPVALVHANTLQEISLGMISSGLSQAIVAARQPGGRVRAALVEAGRSLVVATDDLRIACAEVAQEEQARLPAAVQAIASSWATLMGCLSAPGALVVSADRDVFDGVAVAVAIARHFDLALSEQDIAEIVHDMQPIGVASERDQAERWWNSLPAAAQEMALGAVGPYLDNARDGHLSPITWARDLFFLGDQPNERATGPVDITGRARCLLHGPYIMLPAGSWSLSLTMLFSREAAEHEFLVEICTDRLLASGTIRPQREGSTESNLDFSLDDLTEYPIAIRVSLVRAAFDGAITMVGATLIRAASAADAPQSALVVASE